MFYLYLKTHNVTGLKYLGQTAKDPFEYQGSGKHWKQHIKKHGYDVTTVVLYDTLYKEEISELGLYFSDLWNIVDSKEFANLVPESGNGFIFGHIPAEETRRKLSDAGKLRTHSEVTKLKMRGKIRSEETKNKMSKNKRGNTYRLGKSMSDETKQKISISKMGKSRTPFSEETRQKMSESAKNRKYKVK